MSRQTAALTVRVAYLGPPGTFSEDALRAAIGDEEVEAIPSASVYDAIVAVREGTADRALVPFENSIEGAVTATLDTLAFDADGLALVGEYDLPIRHCLIAREELPLERIEVVLSHPQASAQCARFIRENLPQAEVRAAASTAEAVRTVAESDRPWAALGAESAAGLYGAAVLRHGVEDEADNITRFVWVAPAGDQPVRVRAVADLARLLGAGRGPPGRPRGRAPGLLRPRRQPDPDRVAAAAARPRPLPVLPRHRGCRRR